MNRIVVWFGMLAIVSLVGCAGAPKEEAPAEAAAPAVDQQAKAAAQAAIAEARAAVDEARRLGALWRDSEEILQEAVKAFDAGDYEKAKILANEARNQAELATNQYYLEKAKPLIDQAQEYRDAMTPQQRQQLQAAEQAYAQRQGKKAYEIIKPLMGAVSAQPVPLKPTKETYVVQRGDNLWDIAARFKIYDDPQKWPLIFRVNADKVRDADLIHPGEVLTIDRAASPEAVAAAIEHARSRGPWKLGVVEQTDREYLRRWGGMLRIE